MPAEVDTNLNARAYQESSGKQAQKGFFGFGEAGRSVSPGINPLGQAVKPVDRNLQTLNATAWADAVPNNAKVCQLA